MSNLVSEVGTLLKSGTQPQVVVLVDPRAIALNRGLLQPDERGEVPLSRQKNMEIAPVVSDTDSSVNRGIETFEIFGTNSSKPSGVETIADVPVDVEPPNGLDGLLSGGVLPVGIISDNDVLDEDGDKGLNHSHGEEEAKLPENQSAVALEPKKPSDDLFVGSTGEPTTKVPETTAAGDSSFIPNNEEQTVQSPESEATWNENNTGQFEIYPEVKKIRELVEGLLNLLEKDKIQITAAPVETPPIVAEEKDYSEPSRNPSDLFTTTEHKDDGQVVGALDLYDQSASSTPIDNSQINGNGMFI